MEYDPQSFWPDISQCETTEKVIPFMHSLCNALETRYEKQVEGKFEPVVYSAPGPTEGLKELAALIGKVGEPSERLTIEEGRKKLIFLPETKWKLLLYSRKSFFRALDLTIGDVFPVTLQLANNQNKAQEIDSFEELKQAIKDYFNSRYFKGILTYLTSH